MSAPEGEPAGAEGPTIGNRWPEVAVAALLFAAGATVVTDSLRVGIGWADDGPRSGYFPFYIGLLLMLSSAAVFVGQLRRWRRDHEVFAERAQVAQVASVFVPTAAYVALILPLGIYVASALLIAYFMRRLGRYRWLPALAVALAVPAVVFAVFERWFLVPLPKGPLERLLGL
jgi:hypothetical protein